MTSKKSPRKRKELDLDSELIDSYKKNFDCSNIYLKKQFPLTDNHTKFYFMSQNPNTNMVFIDGAAGTMKTYIAVYSALELLKDRHVDQIIYIRTVVESSSRSIGALPGELEDKFGPYSMPLVDKLNEIVDVPTQKSLFEQHYIKAIPVNFVRGLTFNNSAVIMDECFEDTICVETDLGRVQLKKILKSPDKYKVLSFNELTKKFEYKKVTNTFEKGEKLISKMVLDGRSCIRSTKNHRYLTLDGWKSMEEIKVGDGIISSSNNKHSKKQLNSDQNDMIIGGILGDFSLQEVNPNSFRIQCIHGIKQEEYIKFKCKILNSVLKQKEKNGYSDKPAFKFNTNSFYLPIEHTNRKKYAIENLNLKSLAIAWQDDGYYLSKTKYGILYSCADNEEMNILLEEKLNNMGYSCVAETTKNGQNRTYHQIRFRVDGFDKMCKDIATYVHPCMSYKLPEKYHDLIGQYEWNDKFEDFSIRVVSSIDYDIETNKVYDIEVEDNHNFVVSNMLRGDGTKIVAHNCQNMTKNEITTVLTRFGRNSKYFVVGDMNQADIKDSGFEYVFKAFDTEHSRKNNIHCIKFDHTDIVRSPILKHITQVLKV